MSSASKTHEQLLKLSEKERQEVETLEEKIQEMTPARGSQLEDIGSFDLFPISEATKRALKSSKFVKPTKIQTGAIPHALAGRDLLGAAKTGSGKTLAFLIPMLEKLYRARWSVEDGLGAIVISPTRELALQIFEVLRSIGKTHTFSAGLVIGGKNFKEEQYRLIRMNILICTPGRLLQHMEQTPNFDCTNIQMLILDEADRILDMGFSKQLTSIIEYLPVDRQTILFSATQTKSIKDLARLSLKEPEYIAVHEKSSFATPKNLQQNFVVCDLGRKLDVLLSFIKSHLKQKTIVFLSTCRQVRFVHEVFCKMQPGVPLCALHGKYKQGKRVEIYYEFLNKPAAVMFATDIAARGLDFPSVDWVFQLDCPEDTANYIHRVGRTARYNKNGKALICLTPFEVEGMKKNFEEAKIPIKEIKLNPKKTNSCRGKMTSLLAADRDLKAMGQKAFMSYVRSVHLQPNKAIFDLQKQDLNDFAHSLGLPGAPRMPFLMQNSSNPEEMREELRKKKNVNRKLQNLKEKIKQEKERKKLEKNLNALKKQKTIKEEKENEEEEDDDLMVVKRRHEWGEDQEEKDDDEIDLDQLEEESKRKKKKQKIKVDPVGNTNNKIVFDEEGNSMKPFEKLAAKKFDEKEEDEEKMMENIEERSKAFALTVVERLKKKDKEDRALEKERIRAKHQKKRMKLKGEKEEDEEEQQQYTGAVLGGQSDRYDTEEEEEEEENHSSDSESDSNDHHKLMNQEEIALQMLQNTNSR